MGKNTVVNAVYGIGVGCGDPELLTLKAVRILKTVDILVVPGKEPRKSLAYRIAAEAVPEILQKEITGLEFPMVKDQEILMYAWERAADYICSILKSGRSVGFPVIGDPVIYSTFSYVEEIVRKRGFRTEYINGVPSFCSAAASLGIPLIQEEESLRIGPPDMNGENETRVYMKGGREIGKLKKKLLRKEGEAYLVEKCGMPEERCYVGADTFPDTADYLSLVIEKSRT